MQNSTGSMHSTLDTDRDAAGGALPAAYVQVQDGRASTVAGGVIHEAMVCISLNGRELATFMCSPIRLEELALGFLRSEGIITALADVAALTVAANGRCVDVWLHDVNRPVPDKRIITSGCGGGVTFDDLSERHPPLPAGEPVRAEQITAGMQQLMQAATLYREVRGVHTSALSDGQTLLLAAQDVGRHNTIDRLWGQALQQGMATEGRLLFASGRISSEMITKAAKMGAPIIVSRTSPTSLSVELGKAWHVTLIGYCRRDSFRIYSVPERIQLSDSPTHPLTHPSAHP
jgi:FdhD protein